MRAEAVIRGWLENTLRTYARTVNDQVAGELRAEAIILLWVSDGELSYFEASNLFDEMVADAPEERP